MSRPLPRSAGPQARGTAPMSAEPGESHRTRERPPRPVVGPLLAAVGAIHVALTPLLFGKSVRSVLDGGVVGTVEADPELAELRGVGFWYATAGLALVALGLTVGDRERQDRPLPAALPLSLAGLGGWGIVLMPKSPFWVFPVLAGVAERRRRAARRTAVR